MDELRVYGTWHCSLVETFSDTNGIFNDDIAATTQYRVLAVSGIDPTFSVQTSTYFSIRDAVNEAIDLLESIATPPEVGSLRFWFDAGDQNSLYTDPSAEVPLTIGGTIGQWVSKSDGSILSQSSELLRPILVSNFGAVQYGLRFDNGTYFTGNNTLKAFLQNAAGATVITVVSQPAHESVSKRIFYFSTGSSGGSLRLSALTISGGLYQHQARRLDADSGYTAGSVGSYVEMEMVINVTRVDYTTRLIETIVYDPNNDPKKQTLITGTVGTPSPWGSASAVSNTASITANLGAGDSGNLQFKDGVIWEYIGYNKALSDSELDTIINYLVTKWSVV